MVFAPGVIVGQNIRLLRPLARGGMGSVWVAEHLGLDTQVAVKFIDEALSVDENILARFTREAAAAAQIRSHHVVQIFDHGSIDGRIPYIVMELLEGESLGGRIGRLGQLSLEETAVVLTQTCKALSKVHGLSIVHRDIKPDNIFLIDSDGELFVKLLDFGIAKRRADESSAMTGTGMAVGTPHYMSPEQLLSSKDVTPATDLWALGAVAYRALTGQVPFDGETYGAVCAAVSRSVFTPPRALRPDLPEAVNAWFDKALAAAPANRFASARELAETFVASVGLTTARLAVPSALPKPLGTRDSSPSPDAGSGGGTLTAAGVSESGEGSSFPGRVNTRTATPGTPKAGFRSPSGPSIGVASLPGRGDIHSSGPRNALLFLVGCGVAVVLLVGVLFSRRGPPVGLTAGTSPGGVTAPAPTFSVAPSATRAAGSETAAPPASTASAPADAGTSGAAYLADLPSRPRATPIATSRPIASPPRVVAPPAPPPSERETDHGF